MQKQKTLIFSICLVMLFTGCQSGNVAIDTQTPERPTATVTNTLQPSTTWTATPTPLPTETPSPTLEPMDDFLQGVFYAAYWKDDFSKPYNPWTLENVVKALGANWISVHFLCEQMTDRSTEIICGENNRITKADVENIVNLAHNLSLRVFMEIGITINNNPEHFGKGFNNAQWEEWFEGYKTHITDYAAYAEALNVDMFSLGSEMEPTHHRQENWREIASAVREVYHGPIIYSSDARGSTVSGESWLDIEWWDAVDYIGIHPYDTAPADHNNPTVDEMVANLTPMVDRLETLSQKYDRPVIISELMYPSIDGTSRGMGVMWDSNLSYELDLEEHADVHRALIQVFSNRKWWRGLFIGDYSAGFILNPPENILWSMYGKPAENVIRNFYGGTPQPSATPFATPKPMTSSSHMIYMDGFLNNWDYWPPDNNFDLVDLNQHEIAKDITAIEVELNYWSDIWFTPPLGLPVSDYDWIVFELYLPKVKVWNPEHGNFHPVTLMMVLFGGPNNATPFRVIFSDPPYLEGGVRANEWMTVKIPLDAFGPLVVPEIVAFSMQNLSENTIRMYVDNVKLLKE